MGRIAGRRGRVYMGIVDDAAVATPLPFFASWSIDFATDKIEVTAMGDDNKVYVGGLPDASGMFAGFYDDATNQTYTAAVDGLARKFYLYPNATLATQYFFGTILPDFSVSAEVSGAVSVSAKWAASTKIAKVG
jgi:hypothetical protein